MLPLLVILLTGCAKVDPLGAWEGSAICEETFGFEHNDVFTFVELSITEGDEAHAVELSLSSNGRISSYLVGEVDYDADALFVGEVEERGRSELDFDVPNDPVALEGNDTSVSQLEATRQNTTLALSFTQRACGATFCTEGLDCEMTMVRPD